MRVRVLVQLVTHEELQCMHASPLLVAILQWIARLMQWSDVHTEALTRLAIRVVVDRDIAIVWIGRQTWQ